MRIHEYQAKELLKSYGVPVSDGLLIEEGGIIPEHVCYPCVVKAQIHSGGRGKAGGVKMAGNETELKKAVRELLGSRLVTKQTGPEGKTVHKLFLVPAERTVRECYLSILPDYEKAELVILASRHGGMEIEQLAGKEPGSICRQPVSIMLGLREYQIRNLAVRLDLSLEQEAELRVILNGAVKLFLEKDCSLLEINPLAEREDGSLSVLDAKIVFDDNALARHPELAFYFDPLEEEEKERRAKEENLSYVSLDGTIGCMVNGAGLAMATMDMIKSFGGRPANFLDVGGSATKERVKKAFEILTSDRKVKVILVNIFGGIMRCDTIASGILAAADELKNEVPIIVRLEGTNAKEGHQILEKSGLKLISEETMREAAKKAVMLAGREEAP